MEGPKRGKVESKITRNLERRNEMGSPMDDSNRLPDKFWGKTIGASDGSDRISLLYTRFGYEAT
jgi:hypothetical protein